ncbi:hypothetical protein ACTJIJ_11770 [Niabella sp. 22666]|uniref:hypothetical protein n=1 Tax=Niabella sp. 22666 TaxID=3453954 RepID=UPI003F858964
MAHTKFTQIDLLSDPEKILTITFLDGSTYITRPKDLDPDWVKQLKRLVHHNRVFVMAARLWEKANWYELTEQDRAAIYKYIM